MTAEEARQIVVEGINYAAYKETDSSLYDSDKNRLFGSDHYNSGLTMIQIWQPEHSATIVRLDSLFAHDNGLLCPQRSGKTGQ